MKKKIIVITISLMAFAIALAGNSWAARERGGNRHLDRGDRFQRADNPVDRGHFRGRGNGHIPRRNFVRPEPGFKHKYFKRHHYRPAHRFMPKHYKGRHYRAPHRFHPKFRHRRHRPVYRRGHPGHFKWRHSHSVVKEINNYYGSTDDYALPAEAFQASASVSDSGFFRLGGCQKNKLIA